MKCKYKVVANVAKIEEVQIEKETEKSIWIDLDRYNKVSERVSFYNTWEEAQSALYEKQKKRVEALRRQLEVAKGVLGNIKGMKKRAINLL